LPRRSNTFQDLVAIVQHHLVGSGTIEESAMLEPVNGGEPAEVDVVIRTSVAGHSLTIGIEATKTSRKAGREWVERMIGKHTDLPTDKLVLYSGSGFTPEARRKAAQNGVELISVESVDGEADLESAVLGQLRTLWPRFISVTRRAIMVRVEQQDGTLGVGPAEKDLGLFSSDGQPLENVTGLYEVVDRSLLESPSHLLDDLRDEVGADAFERSAALLIEAPRALEDDGSLGDVYLRDDNEKPPELRRLDAIAIKCDVRISAESPVSLEHARLGAVTVTSGEFQVEDASALFVATESDRGLNFSVRFYDDLPSALRHMRHHE